MKAVIYRRVSTKHQAGGDGLRRQLDECYKRCEVMEYDIFAVITDVNSGANPYRPGLVQLDRMVRSRSVDIVVVESHDRFNRGSHTGEDLLEFMRENDIDLDYASTDFRTFAAKIIDIMELHAEQRT